jgi:hypothetical protein
VENIFAVAPQKSDYVVAWRDARETLTRGAALVWLKQSAGGVATKKAGYRSLRSGPEVQHLRSGRGTGLIGIPPTVTPSNASLNQTICRGS